MESEEKDEKEEEKEETVIGGVRSGGLPQVTHYQLGKLLKIEGHIFYDKAQRPKMRPKVTKVVRKLFWH